MLGGESVPPLQCPVLLPPAFLAQHRALLVGGSGGAVLQQNCFQESQECPSSWEFSSVHILHLHTWYNQSPAPRLSRARLFFPCVLCELCFWPLLQEFSSWPCFSAHEKSQILLSTAQFGYKYLSVDDRRLKNHSINVAALGVEKVLRICDSETGSMTPLSQLSCSLPQHSSLHQNYCCWEFCVVFSSPLALLLICQVYKAFFPVTLILISVEKKKLILIYWGRKQKK